MNLIALLPMKGHSERIAGKNMKEFAGRPLYHAIMEVLLKSSYVKEIVINTDSDLIASDALLNYDRTKIIERPRELCGDSVSMNKIIAYDLSKMPGDYFLQTHSTNPLLTVNALEQAIKCFFDNLSEYDSLFSVTKHQSRFYRADGSAVNHDPGQLIRTQELLPVLEENSNFYIFSKQSFAQSGNKRIGLRPFMFELNRYEAIDIDEPEDWQAAEVLFKRGKDGR